MKSLASLVVAAWASFCCYSPPPALPTGVTLQAIDGETLTSSTTMSHNYFANNGYTAATNKAYNGTSWDDTTFWPNQIWFGIRAGDLADFQAEGFTITNNADAGLTSTISANGIWYVMGNFTPQAGTWSGSTSGLNVTLTSNTSGGFGAVSSGSLIYGSDGTNSLPVGTTLTSGSAGGTGTYSISNACAPSDCAAGTTFYIAGGSFQDPRGSYTPGFISDESFVTGFIGSAPDTDLFSAGRFVFWTQPGVNVLEFGHDSGGSSFPTASMLSSNFFTTPAGNHLSIGIFACDTYWFAGATGAASLPTSAGNIFSGAAFTQDQMQRGSNYGNMIDVYRWWSASTANTGGATSVPSTAQPAARLPFFSIIEESNGLLSPGTPVNITPAEMHWAGWSSIIHGARGNLYFTYSGTESGGFTNVGTTGGTYSQIITDNADMGSLARVLNSPFAINYASVTPNGYTFPVPEVSTSAKWLQSGVEVMTKWYQGGSYTVSNANSSFNGATIGNGFYIFATTRDSEATTNIAATFTVNDPNATAWKELISGTTGTISGGTFSYTFPNSYTVAIFQIAG